MNVDELTGKISKYLSSRLGASAEIKEMRSLSGGACQDNYLVDLHVAGGQHSGDHKLVLRTDKGGSLLSSLSRADEFAVCDLAFSAGVKTPKPMWLETDRAAIGQPFYFMERITGSANGRFVVKDPSITQVRKNLSQLLSENLARIHSVKPSHVKDPVLLEKLKHTPDLSTKNAANIAVRELRVELKNLPEAHPALELILNWLDQNAPESDDLVLVHGDFRTGNFMLSPDGLQGIVDWEFAHFGDRHEDVSWLCMKDWRFGKVNKEVGGFADRDEFYAAYHKASGIALDPKKVLYWEVMGNARWGIGSAGQAERHLSGKDKGIELAAIGRRTGEMEMESMRLIESAG